MRSLLHLKAMPHSQHLIPSHSITARESLVIVAPLVMLPSPSLAEKKLLCSAHPLPHPQYGNTNAAYQVLCDLLFSSPQPLPRIMTQPPNSSPRYKKGLPSLLKQKRMT